MIRWMVYGAVLASTVYTAVLYNSAALLFLAEVELLPLLLFLLLFVQRLFCRISFSQTEYFLEAGKEGMLPRLWVENKTGIPMRRLQVRIRMENETTKERVKRKVRYAIDKRESDVPVLEQEPGYGIWQLSCEKIRLYDLSGCFFLRKWGRIRCRLVCLPKAYEMKGIQKGAGEGWEEGTVRETGTVPKDPSFLCQVREYRQGDRIQDVHWKLSAKKGDLLVKEYGWPKEDPLVFGLNTAGLDPERMELIYSLLMNCVHGRQELLLVWKEKKTGRLMECQIRTEEEAAFGMEELMRYGVQAWNQNGTQALSGQMSFGGRGHWLWLTEDLSLVMDSVKIREFSRGGLKQQIMDMELVL